MISAPEARASTIPTTMWWRWTPLALPQPRTRAARVYRG